MTREEMKRLLVIVLLAATLAAPARADEGPAAVVHRVDRSDTLPLLAAEYYGDRNLAVFIMAANAMEHPRRLRPGEKLTIPTSLSVYAVAGDTLEALAERYLGDARRAPFLAEFNALEAGITLAEGQAVTIPFHITHTARTRESLRQLAANFYGTTNRWKLLRDYNFRDSDRALNPGEVIIIPIIDVRIQDSKLPPLDPEQAVRARRRQQVEDAAGRALPAAEGAWARGDYSAVKRELTELDVDYLPPEVAAKVSFLLGSAYVAFADMESARAQFKKVLVRRPDHVVRADLTSPKIVALWKQIGGKVQTP